jgi:uncharacterized membrane protein YkvA (DUF1232 family)
VPGWLLVGLAVVVVLYAGTVLGLVLFGRRTDARAIAGFVPDCAVLVSRLIRDPDLPRRRRVVLLLAAGYLALPIDLVPDFLPVVGYLDDAVVVVLVVRSVVRTVGADQLAAYWPGPDRSLQLLLRLARSAEGAS